MFCQALLACVGRTLLGCWSAGCSCDRWESQWDAPCTVPVPCPTVLVSALLPRCFLVSKQAPRQKEMLPVAVDATRHGAHPLCPRFTKGLSDNCRTRGAHLDPAVRRPPLWDQGRCPLGTRCTPPPAPRPASGELLGTALRSPFSGPLAMTCPDSGPKTVTGPSLGRFHVRPV